MLTKELEKYLDKKNIHYETISHTPAYTASETAQVSHIAGDHLAKIVIVKIDDDFVMTVLPAHIRLDLSDLKKVTKAKHVELAHEYEFNEKFPECEVGAMPPFGDLYDMDVYLADSLSHQKWLAFNCGTHSELVKMPLKDFLALVHPTLLKRC